MPESVVEAWECTRCGYKWAKQKDKNDTIIKPIQCANIDCRSPYWDRPRKESSK